MSQSINQTTIIFMIYFLLNSNIYEYFTRQSNCGDVFHNHKRSSIWFKSIRYVGVKAWNELPKVLKTSASRFSSKNNLKKFIQKLHVNLNYFGLDTLKIMLAIDAKTVALQGVLSSC